jgi:hypothetical protein
MDGRHVRDKTTTDAVVVGGAPDIDDANHFHGIGVPSGLSRLHHAGRIRFA